jgi:hypothetical protein
MFTAICPASQEVRSATECEADNWCGMRSDRCYCRYGRPDQLRHQPPSADANCSSGSNGSQHCAYTTYYGFVLMRGNQVVAKVSETSPIFANGNQVIWTQGGDYVVYLSQWPDGDSSPTTQTLTSINTHSE